MATRISGTTASGRKGNASQAQKDKHSRLLSWFQQEMRRQSHNRYQMALDEDYYDSIQWLPDEAAELKERGQNPTVYNEVKPTIDWLIGTERRNRVDFMVISPDGNPQSEDEAKSKTKLLKYIAEANRLEFERSRSANETFKAGLGWIEVGVSPDPEDEPIFVRSESWRNMLYDSLGTRPDLEDSRYLFRFRIMDLDIAIAFFPDKEDQLRASCVSRDEDHYLEWWNGKPMDEIDSPSAMPGKWAMYDTDSWAKNNRERVLLIEAWYKDPTTETSGLGTSAIDRVRMKMQCTVMTEKHIILDAPSPYKHNKYPFVPMWCYRRAKDNAPYGPIRTIRGPQDSLNKRMSKALFVLSTNQTIAEADAFDARIMTAEQARDELMAPDGFVLLAKGGIEKLKTHRENDVAEGHLRLAQADQATIRSASGITSENLGRDSNVTAGIALKQKAEQGGMLTAEIFDNMLLARQLEGELTLSLIEQFYNEPKIFSIEGERHKREYVRINQKDPVTGHVLNDVTARKAQFIIGEQSWRQSLQQAAFEKVMEMLTQLAPVAPQVVVALLPSVFELSDLPNKQQMLQTIRQATGMQDPDEPPTPQQQQAQQQQQALAARQLEAQMASLDAEIAKSKATGTNLDAKTLETTLKAIYVAMQAAQVVSTVPHVAGAADELLQSAGFVDKKPGMPPSPATPQPGVPPFPGMPDSARPNQHQTAEGAPPQQNEGAPQPPQLANGSMQGIETPRGSDGVIQ